MCCQMRTPTASTDTNTLPETDTPVGLAGKNIITTIIAYKTSRNIIIPLAVIPFKNISRFRYNN